MRPAYRRCLWYAVSNCSWILWSILIALSKVDVKLDYVDAGPYRMTE